MPTYFYHLKFELYPFPKSARENGDRNRDGEGGGSGSGNADQHGNCDLDGGLDFDITDVWIPEGHDADIFDTRAWPKHNSVAVAAGRGKGGTEESGREDCIARPGTKIEGAEERVSKIYGSEEVGRAAQYDWQRELQGNWQGDLHGQELVIDCGPQRGSGNGSGRKEDICVTKILGQRPRRKSDFSPSATSAVSSLAKARQDWRFGLVRIEGLDMASSAEFGQGAAGVGEVGGSGRRGERLGHRRGESSASTGNNTSGINAGLETGRGRTVGRVMKARFEKVDVEEAQDGVGGEGKGTNVGWGIVHLYREGEETVGLGLGGTVEVYDMRRDGAGTVDSDGGSGLGSAEKGLDGQTTTEEDCTTLCIPAVPGYFTQSDFLGFVGEKTMQEVSHFRMVMTGRMNRYLVLMKFRDGKVARRWRREWDGKVFNSMEPETCHVAFIRTITFQTPTSLSTPSSKTSYPELSHDPFTPSTNPATTNLKPFSPPIPNLVELPTCPVCLERMDDTTGLLTILCQHVFHCACIRKWRGSGCPVCRHTNPFTTPSPYPSDPTQPPFGSPTASLCSVCDCPSDLWICLICGSVGCGRYKGGHAKEHWKESGHNFALEIETQHVWDYAGDLWVHRLIRGKGDSKLIELPGERGLGGQDSPPHGHGHEGVGDMVPREKLERIGLEYTHLLTSQLESQRVYFEDLVAKAVAKAESAGAQAAAASSRAETALTRLAELERERERWEKEVVPGLERDFEREKRKAEKSAEVARGLSRSLLEEKKVGEGLLARVEWLLSKQKETEREMEIGKKERDELQEMNRDLMFSLGAGEKLREMVREEAAVEQVARDDTGAALELGPEKGKGKEKGEDTCENRPPHHPNMSPDPAKLDKLDLEGGTITLPPPPLTAAERRKGKGKGRAGAGAGAGVASGGRGKGN